MTQGEEPDATMQLKAANEVAKPIDNQPSGLVTKELVVLLEPDSQTAKKFLSVTAQLQHMHVDASVRSFCFISDRRNSGATVVAANVAAGFALSGQRTILLETNFRSPRLSEMFGLAAAKPGLSDWLIGMGGIHAWSFYMQPVYPNLVIMPAGTALREGEALHATELRHLIIELSRTFDIVICDAAPMSDISGTLAVVAAVERTIIVARANQTEMSSLMNFQDLVTKCGGVLGGSVYLDY